MLPIRKEYNINVIRPVGFIKKYDCADLDFYFLSKGYKLCDKKIVIFVRDDF